MILNSWSLNNRSQVQITIYPLFYLLALPESPYDPNACFWTIRRKYLEKKTHRKNIQTECSWCTLKVWTHQTDSGCSFCAYVKRQHPRPQMMCCILEILFFLLTHWFACFQSYFSQWEVSQTLMAIQHVDLAEKRLGRQLLMANVRDMHTQACVCVCGAYSCIAGTHAHILMHIWSHTFT